MADPGRERLGVTWNADYAFMGAEEAEEGMQPTLVMYDDDSKVSGRLECHRKAPMMPLSSIVLRL